MYVICQQEERRTLCMRLSVEKKKRMRIFLILRLIIGILGSACNDEKLITIDRTARMNVCSYWSTDIRINDKAGKKKRKKEAC
jgi:hypothetical protein